MAKLTADDVIAEYDLRPLEGEGGYFRQTWIRESGPGGVPIGTCILYLVTPGSFSALHRLEHDEIFHFYLGDPCEAVSVDPAGDLTVTILGSDITAGMIVQHIVPAGTWQGTRLVEGGEWALLGTTMAPGFHPSGFELATQDTVGGFSPNVADMVRAFVAPHP
jgi:predicted cupin superfamily sugar epimerase